MADSITHFISATRYLKGKNTSAEFKRGLYYGSQGPDIFFFGDKDGSFAFGDSIHDVTPKALFESNFDKLFSEDELYRGYAYGIFLHYFLDRLIHQYIGYLCRTYPKPYAHGEYEKDIDMCIYEKEFSEPIKNFKYNSYFILDKTIIDVAHSYWSERVESEFLTYEFVSGCVKKLRKMTKAMIKPNFLFAKLVNIIEKKKHVVGMISCHLKKNPSDRFMNEDKKPWQSQSGVVNYSVDDMLNIAVSDFEKECDDIEKCRNSGESYIFKHIETFSCGK